MFIEALKLQANWRLLVTRTAPCLFVFALQALWHPRGFTELEVVVSPLPFHVGEVCSEFSRPMPSVT